MIKTITLLTAREGFSQAEFIDYWKNRHAPFAHTAPGCIHIKRYVQNHPIAGLSPQNGFAGVVECWFEDEEAMRLCKDNDYYREVVAADEAKFIDWSRSISFVVTENVVLDR